MQHTTVRNPQMVLLVEMHFVPSVVSKLPVQAHFFKYMVCGIVVDEPVVTAKLGREDCNPALFDIVLHQLQYRDMLRFINGSICQDHSHGSILRIRRISSSRVGLTSISVFACFPIDYISSVSWCCSSGWRVFLFLAISRC